MGQRLRQELIRILIPILILSAQTRGPGMARIRWWGYLNKILQDFF